MKKFIKAALFTLLSTIIFNLPQQISAQDDIINIGVFQHVSHQALDDSREGFVDRLTEEYGDRIEWDIQNANGDLSTLQSISEMLARENDILYAIATPAAQALAGIESEKPIFFAAVAAPVEADLVDSFEEPGRNLTGTTNLGPIRDHIELLMRVFPEAQNIGIIYNASEVNAQHQVDIATEILEENGLTPVVQTITSTNDISQSMTALVAEVDAMLMVTDNTIDSSIALVGDIAKEAGIPTIGSSDSVVKTNGLATISNSYYDYGVQTAEMVIRHIEEGLDPSEMPVEEGNNFELVVNEEFAEAIGVDPASIE